MNEVNFNIKLEDKEYELDLTNKLKFSPETINEDLIKQPALYAWFATIAEMCRSRREGLENQLELLEADLYIRTKNIARSSGDKITETEIKNIVITNSKRQDLVKLIEKAVEDERMAQIARESFGGRKDCLITLASNLRAQQDSSLHILKERARQTVRASQQESD